MSVACVVTPPAAVIVGVALVVSIEPMVAGSSARVNAEAAVEAGGRSVRKGGGRVEELVELELEELELQERRQASIQSWLGGLSCSSSISSSSSSTSASSSSSEL
jgi:thiazolylpeptide-type bacteriocin precursor